MREKKSKIRLDKLLANFGLGSRKRVRQLIRDGRVQLAGQVITDPGFKLENQEAIVLDGQALNITGRLVFMLNKPAGYLTAMSDPHKATIADLVPDRWKSAKLFPVGRLDKDTSGLLLLTNDGQLCHRLSSPKWAIPKKYQLITEGLPWQENEVPIFAEGFQLADGQDCLPADLEIIHHNQVFLTIYEGKYHQVKRMAKHFGHEVIDLKRIQVGNLVLDPDLEPGELRQLTDREADDLAKLCEL